MYRVWAPYPVPALFQGNHRGRPYEPAAGKNTEFTLFLFQVRVTNFALDFEDLNQRGLWPVHHKM